MLTDTEFASHVRAWDTFLEDHERIDLTLHVEPPPPPLQSKNRYFVTYEGQEIDLTYKQANQLHYWFAVKREHRARKYPVPLHI